MRRTGWWILLAALGAGQIACSRDSLAAGGLRVAGLVDGEEIRVSAAMAGRIRRMEADQGAAVTAGQVLAVLDTGDIDSRLALQRARVRQLAARLEQAREEQRLEEDRFRVQVARAEAQLKLANEEQADARTQVEQLRKETAPRQRLEAGVVVREPPETDPMRLDLAEYRMRLLADRAASAQSDLELARAGRHRLPMASDEIKADEALLDQERAQLAETGEQRRQAEVRAPRAGLVTLRLASVGDGVRAGDPVCVLLDPDNVWARVEVEESLAAGLAVGQALPVELPSGEKLRGQVSAIAPEAEFATQRDVSRARRDVHTFAIRVKLPNPGRRVHPGMTAYVTLPAVPR